MKCLHCDNQRFDGALYDENGKQLPGAFMLCLACYNKECKEFLESLELEPELKEFLNMDYDPEIMSD